MADEENKKADAERYQRLLDRCEDRLVQQAVELHEKAGIAVLDVSSMLLRAASALAVLEIGPEGFAAELRKNADEFERNTGKNLN